MELQRVSRPRRVVEVRDDLVPGPVPARLRGAPGAVVAVGQRGGEVRPGPVPGCGGQAERPDRAVPPAPRLRAGERTAAAAGRTQARRGSGWSQGRTEAGPEVGVRGPLGGIGQPPAAPGRRGGEGGETGRGRIPLARRALAGPSTAAAKGSLATGNPSPFGSKSPLQGSRGSRV